MSDGCDDTDTNYLLIETTTLPQVAEVRLYEETWPHIAEEHPEFASRLPSLEHAIVDTIQNPTEVYRSTTSPENSYVFCSSNNLKEDKIMSVPVRVYANTSSARVTTAMFRRNVKGELLYKAGNEA